MTPMVQIACCRRLRKIPDIREASSVINGSAKDAIKPIRRIALEAFSHVVVR
jgi:hypothetical protein